MNEEVRVEAETKGVSWILTGITDDSEYAYRDFISKGIEKAEDILKDCPLRGSQENEVNKRVIS